MIDWITARIPYRHETPILGGVRAGFDETGAMQWCVEQFALSEGSHECTTTVQTDFDSKGAGCGDFSHVVISGNPAKFLQGHNLFGSDNLPELAPRFFVDALAALGHHPDPFTIRRWMDGDYYLSRVDVAQMIDVGGPDEVRETLNALANHAAVAYRGRATVQHGTCQWGKRSSRRVVLKAYDKARELSAGKKHRLPQLIERRYDLQTWASGKVRIEAELHARYLQDHDLRSGRNWHSDTAGLHWSREIEGIAMSTNVVLHPAAIKAMPRALARTYTSWLSGMDLQALGVISRPTFYRHRRQLLAYGIDISIPPTTEHQPRVVNLHSVIACRLAPVPEWAVGTPLYRAA